MASQLLSSVNVATRRRLHRLAAELVRAGDLPSDPRLRVSIGEVGTETPCVLCTEPLGSAPAFAMQWHGRTALLHAHCFSAWFDVAQRTGNGPTQR